MNWFYCNIALLRIHQQKITSFKSTFGWGNILVNILKLKFLFDFTVCVSFGVIWHKCNLYSYTNCVFMIDSYLQFML